MLPQDLKDDCQRAYLLLLYAQRDEMIAEFGAELRKYLVNGPYNSFFHMRFAEIAAAHFDLLAAALRADFFRSITVYAGGFGEADIPETREFIAQYVTSGRQYLLGVLAQQIRSPQDAYSSRYAQVAERMTARHDQETLRELKLLVRTRTADPLSIVNNYIGFTGNVISGNHNTTTVTQTINHGALAPLEKALLAVLDDLRKSSAQATDQQAVSDLIEMVEDAKAEAGKENPNKLKLSSAVQTIGASLTVITNMPAAYAVLKAGAAAVGIHLP
jgi:hypothetical protein